MGSRPTFQKLTACQCSPGPCFCFASTSRGTTPRDHIVAYFTLLKFSVYATLYTFYSKLTPLMLAGLHRRRLGQTHPDIRKPHLIISKNNNKGVNIAE